MRIAQMEKKPEYQISSSMNEGVHEIVMKGELIQGEHDRMSLDMITLISSMGANNVLVDIRALRGRLSITETYERVRNYPPHMYKTYVAMVDIPENSDYSSFHETTAANAGMKLRFFTDIDTARTWLKKK
jgi:hypothetical protein